MSFSGQLYFKRCPMRETLGSQRMQWDKKRGSCSPLSSCSRKQQPINLMSSAERRSARPSGAQRLRLGSRPTSAPNTPKRGSGAKNSPAVVNRTKVVTQHQGTHWECSASTLFEDSGSQIVDEVGLTTSILQQLIQSPLVIGLAMSQHKDTSQSVVRIVTSSPHFGRI